MSVHARSRFTVKASSCFPASFLAPFTEVERISFTSFGGSGSFSLWLQRRRKERKPGKALVLDLKSFPETQEPFYAPFFEISRSSLQNLKKGAPSKQDPLIKWCAGARNQLPLSRKTLKRPACGAKRRAGVGNGLKLHLLRCARQEWRRQLTERILNMTKCIRANHVLRSGGGKPCLLF